MARLPALLFPGLLAAVLAVASAVAPAHAQEIVADLSHREVAISTGFTGENLLLFGATDGAGDIVVIVSGPKRDEVVRRKERVAGIWINGASVTFRDVPAYYRVAASKPLDKIAPREMLERLEIGAARLDLSEVQGGTAQEIRDFRAAFIRNKQRQDLYGTEVSEIAVRRGRLFRTSIPFPANVPTGEYQVTVYLFKDGRLVNREHTPLAVRKVGLEAKIFRFAHEQAAWYGAIAIAIALFAGWLAGVIFRRT